MTIAYRRNPPRFLARSIRNFLGVIDVNAYMRRKHTTVADSRRQNSSHVTSSQRESSVTSPFSDWDKDDKSWDDLQKQLGASFLQSTGWARFQVSLGVLPHRFYGSDWSALCLEYRTRVGTYWFMPYGPTAKSDAALKKALRVIKEKAKQANVHWLRIEPYWPVNDMRAIEPLAVHSPQHLNPEYSIVNDLSEDEATMRSRLSSSKRNLINRGAKGRLRYEISTKPESIAIFTDMLHVVEKRTGARSHSDDYYRKQAEVLMPLGMLTLAIAFGPEDQPLATTILLHNGGVTSRVYAASYPEARKFEAGVGLDWYTMLDAKASGMRLFDFYGAAAPDAPPTHPFAGFTKYKSEFGGEHIRHGGTWDIPLSASRYRMYVLLRRLRRIIG